MKGPLLPNSMIETSSIRFLCVGIYLQCPSTDPSCLGPFRVMLSTLKEFDLCHGTIALEELTLEITATFMDAIDSILEDDFWDKLDQVLTTNRVCNLEVKICFSALILLHNNQPGDWITSMLKKLPRLAAKGILRVTNHPFNDYWERGCSMTEVDEFTVSWF